MSDVRKVLARLSIVDVSAGGMVTIAAWTGDVDEVDMRRYRVYAGDTITIYAGEEPDGKENENETRN